MFEIGFSELLMVALVSLLVLGPERLPKAARFVGFWIGRTRSMLANMRSEFEQELQIEDMRNSLIEKTGLDEVQKLSDQMSATTQAMQNAISGEEIYAMYHTRKEELKSLVENGLVTDTSASSTATDSPIQTASDNTSQSVPKV